MSPSASSATAQETETSEVTLELVTMTPDTPPPPPKDYTLVPSYEDDQTEPSSPEGEGEREIVHTSSFSFTAHNSQFTH